MTDVFCLKCDEPINADNDHFTCESCGETCCEYCQVDCRCMDCGGDGADDDCDSDAPDAIELGLVDEDEFRD